MQTTEFARIMRTLLGAAGAIVFLLGTALAVSGEIVAGFGMLVAGGVLLLAALYEQTRYRARADEPAPAASGPGARPPGAGFRRTDEVFDDPTTGQRTRVWYDPATGERRYVPEP
jgi:hypothetical protein